MAQSILWLPTKTSRTSESAKLPSVTSSVLKHLPPPGKTEHHLPGRESLQQLQARLMGTIRSNGPGIVPAWPWHTAGTARAAGRYIPGNTWFCFLQGWCDSCGPESQPLFGFPRENFHPRLSIRNSSASPGQNSSPVTDTNSCDTSCFLFALADESLSQGHLLCPLTFSYFLLLFSLTPYFLACFQLWHTMPYW